MPQRPANQGATTVKNHAFASMIDELPEGATITRRKDGSVWLTQPYPKSSDPKKGGPDFTRVRVDSRKDRDSIAKGEIPWWMPHLERAERAARKQKDAE